MNIIDTIKKRINVKRKIVLPESEDKRVLSAARILADENIVDVILIGNKDIISNNISLNNITVIDPNICELSDILINNFYELRKDKGITLEDAKNIILNDYMYFACMLVKCNYADGVVSGAIHSSSDTLRASLQVIKAKNDLVSSFTLVETNNNLLNNQVFVFSDCGLIENPTSQQLAKISKLSASSFKLITNDEPKVSLLSYSTYGSAKGDLVDKVKNAVDILSNEDVDFIFDGEMQLDAAVIKEVAEIKCPNSKIKGDANVLIFPNLEAGNIGYKLVERFGGASTYGPITQGLNKPVNDLSRGCKVEDIVGTVYITALQVED